MNEFEIIKHYFTVPGHRKDVLMGPGDDCALLQVPPHSQLAVSTDTLVSGVHFFADMAPMALGHKALAVNLSDLAAMGADPCWVSLALTLPEIDESWIKGFCAGFFELAEYYNVALVGGDMTRGPLSITVTVHGTLPEGKGLRRNGARVGDGIYVTGTLGDAALGLQQIQGKVTVPEQYRDFVRTKFEFPHPRILAGQALRDIASSALDLSDGLAGDLAHVARASGVRAQLELERLPLSAAMLDSVSREQGWELALTGGDDYELCFTVPEIHRGQLETALAHCGVKFTRVGRMLAGEPGVELMAKGRSYQLSTQSWDHFRSTPA
ncbi:thiamine-phosphate kinase [Oceanisphaera psychrotolerans]|uniref:Thiamine-monophosphate kinase n=1 Tax=Oceanisphaera psychrotolerans TaxID=1414654 RepID=A0A1J4QH33_9GAMM|nr:thiamine-phosphate kinase [Oceanisphaera psychrotolerans]OIN13771.1 thiamine-phosphate kinase [Oceanisphaera psychrotolerans]